MSRLPCIERERERDLLQSIEHAWSEIRRCLSQWLCEANSRCRMPRGNNNLFARHVVIQLKEHCGSCCQGNTRPCFDHYHGSIEESDATNIDCESTCKAAKQNHSTSYIISGFTSYCLHKYRGHTMELYTRLVASQTKDVA